MPFGTLAERSFYNPSPFTLWKYPKEPQSYRVLVRKGSNCLRIPSVGRLSAKSRILPDELRNIFLLAIVMLLGSHLGLS